MPLSATLGIRQEPPVDRRFPIELRLKRPGQLDQEARAAIAFALTGQEQADPRSPP